MTQLHFISGLPRSGSTLLAAILRQNPSIHASMSSPLGTSFNALHKSMSGGNEAGMFYTDAQRAEWLADGFRILYRDWPIAFDTNRMWPSKLPILTKLFPQAKFICCVRRPAWIVDSIEKLIRENSFELSGIFGFEPGGTVYSRVQGITSPTGLLGFALNALMEGYYSPLAEGRMLLVEYEALAKFPRDTVDALYDWLGIPRFLHNFARIEQIPGAAEFDVYQLKTPGLHSVRPKVEFAERASVLPPQVFQSLPQAFWRAAPNPVIPLLHVDEGDGEKPASPPSKDQVNAMMAESDKMLALYSKKENVDVSD